MIDERHHRALVDLAVSVIEATPASDWRHHGFGLLSVYVTPAHRLNLWSKDVQTIQPHQGGMHSHSARISSTVLAGAIYDTQLSAIVDGGDHDEWIVEGDGLRKTGRRVLIMEGARWSVRPGGCRVTERGLGHCTQPGDGVAVTSVLVEAPTDDQPRVWVPSGTTPLPAFGQRCSDEIIDKVRARAVARLTSVFEPSPSR